MKDRSWLLGARSARGARNLRRAGVKVKPVYRKRKGEAVQMACGVCARSTRRAASLPGEGSTHLRGCGMTAVGTFRTWCSCCAMSVRWARADVAIARAQVRIRGAKIRAEGARERARQAIRDWSIRTPV